VNSCGKSFHIEARHSSARQCWLVLAYIASQYCTSHDNPTDWLRSGDLNISEVILSQNRSLITCSL